MDSSSAMAAGPGTRSSGSLLRAEVHRFRSRRFIQVVIGLAVVGWIVAVVIGLTAYSRPSAEDLAAAQQQREQAVTDSQAGYEECLDDPRRPQDQPVEMVCGTPPKAQDFQIEQFLDRAPFDLADAGAAGAMSVAAASTMLAFLIGATWIGAEWSTRSIVALLFWVPRRLRVMSTKIGVLLLATAVLGVLAQAAWLAMAGILNAVHGSGNALPGGFWGDLVATQARGVLITVIGAAAGFGLANLVRNTAAALGIGFVYFAIAETAIRMLHPAWEPWLLSNNAAGLLSPKGLTVFIYDDLATGAEGQQPREYLITNLQGGLVLGLAAAVIVAVGVILFARRELH